jgi:NTE family protein
VVTDGGPRPAVAFVLGGGGILGASEVGMLRALLRSGVVPDLVVGTSVGAVNGAFLAADPTLVAVDRLAEMWVQAAQSGVFSDSVRARAQRVVRLAGHLHSGQALEGLLVNELGTRDIEDLAVRFQCVAAQIETATARWFDRGSVVDAVMASCAVPGLLPPREIAGAHFVDGGLVHSIPVSRALDLGATQVYVLQVGRIEHTLRAPRWPWEVGLVAFEIARRYRFNEELARVPDEVEVHILPSGAERSPSISLSYRGPRLVAERIEAAEVASQRYLTERGLGVAS